MMYVARYMSKIKDKKLSFKESILPLWIPVFLILILILPSNLSTTALIFLMVITLVFLGGYPIRYLLAMLGVGLIALLLFITVMKAFPNLMDDRLDTWESRIENFFDGGDSEGDYQIERAKIAIASGKIIGLGPGGSKQKNFLPQSSSDFIFAIICEEYGLTGGIFILGLYLWLLFRCIVMVTRCPKTFGAILAMGLCLNIVINAFTNIAVAVQLVPATGLNLPLVSMGGTSIVFTCISLGVILSVSKFVEEAHYDNLKLAKIEQRDARSI